jgi:hypothetical protein
MHRESISEDCRRIAQRHGLEVPRRQWSPLTWLQRLLPRLRIFVRRVVLNPRDLQVGNVRDAAIASQHIYAFARHGPVPWFLLLTISAIQQVVMRIKARFE